VLEITESVLHLLSWLLPSTELATGVPIVYKIDEEGKVLEKKILE
jgi:hypothetical protein